MTIDLWIFEAARKTPNKPAIIFGDEVLDYQSMANQIEMKAIELSEAGIAHGDRVAWYGLNHPQVFILLFACARIGAIFVPLNWRLAPPELSAIVADCRPKVCIHSEEFSDQALSLGLDNVVAFGSSIEATSSETIYTSVIKPKPHDPVLIVYTSGSTGNPKGVVLTQKALTCNAAMSIHAHCMTEDDFVLNVLPLFHVGGLNILPTPAFSVGATVLLLEKFEPVAACYELQRASLAIMVPTVLEAIMKTSGWHQFKFQNLRGLSIGSTDVPISMIEAVHEKVTVNCYFVGLKLINILHHFK